MRCLWDIYRQAREQEIAKEISSAALEVQASLEQIIVANGRLRYWEDRIGQIKAREAGGAMAMSPLEQTQAELRRLEAQPASGSPSPTGRSRSCTCGGSNSA